MKFKSYIDEIKHLGQKLSLSPKDFWQENKENSSSNLFIRNTYLLAVLLLGLSAFFGELLWSKAFLWDYALGLSIRECLYFFLLWLIGRFIIAALGENFRAKTKNGLMSSLVAVGLLPTVLISIVINLMPGLYPLHILGLYGFYLFYLGVKQASQIAPENQMRYTLLALVLLILVSGLLYTISWTLFKALFNHGI